MIWGPDTNTQGKPVFVSLCFQTIFCCHDFPVMTDSALRLWAKIKLSPISCFVRHCTISARQVPNTMSWTFVLEQLMGGLCTRPIWKVDLESDWTMQIYWLIVEITHWFCTCSNSFYWMGVGKWEIPTEAASLFILCVIKNKRSTYLPCRKITLKKNETLAFRQTELFLDPPANLITYLKII